MRISLDAIAPDPSQPRKEFDKAELEILANSILQNGLMQPITVRPRDREAGTFWIVAGERRFRAHCWLRQEGHKIASIECIVNAPKNTKDLRVRQIVENIARADLRPLEEAQAYQDLLDTGMGAIEAAKRLGVPRNRVESRLALLNLDEQIQTMLRGAQVTLPQANEIARLPEKRDQIRIMKMLARGELGAWKSLTAAVDAILNKDQQKDMFGGGATKADVELLGAMEKKIDQIVAMVAKGWKEGECIIATKVSPDRAKLMAEKLSHLRVAIRHMEQELRNVTAQHNILASHNGQQEGF